MSSENKDENKQEEKQEAAPKSYRDRLKTLRKGQEFYQQDDIPKAVDYYTQYLHAIAKYNKVDEKKLLPKHFDKDKDMAELLLVSHVYWDLAKAYDRSPNLHHESVRCLDQFVKFTTGFKYQHVNARMLRNYIRKRMAHNTKAFKQAYDRIQVESKGCFISSDLFGPTDTKTHQLRNFKKSIVHSKSGYKFTEIYYQYLSPLYFYIDKKAPRSNKYIFKPLLKLSLSRLASHYPAK